MLHVDTEGRVIGLEIEAVSLRTTRLRSGDGTVWHVPNGEIRRVGNMSQHWSRAVLDIDVAIIGSGVLRSKLLLAGGMLGRLPRAEVVDGLGR